MQQYKGGNKMVTYQYTIHTNGQASMPITEIAKADYDALIDLFIESGVELRGVTIDDAKAGGAYKVTHFARVCEDGNIFEAYFIAIFEREDEIQ